MIEHSQSQFKSKPLSLEKIHQLFLRSLVNGSARISAGAQAKNWAEVRSIAHQIRGTAGAFRYDFLALHAGNIEDAIRTGESDKKILQHCEEFDHAAQCLIKTIRP
jgi:HPt (histidine-containing phosphotransfer) domain-containing protein